MSSGMGQLCSCPLPDEVQSSLVHPATFVAPQDRTLKMLYDICLFGLDETVPTSSTRRPRPPTRGRTAHAGQRTVDSCIRHPWPDAPVQNPVLLQTTSTYNACTASYDVFCMSLPKAYADSQRAGKKHLGGPETAESARPSGLAMCLVAHHAGLPANLVHTHTFSMCARSDRACAPSV
jgi:hypothetical protein